MIQEILDQVLATPLERSLATCRPARPLPAQRRIVADAIAMAGRHGLTAAAFQLRWVHGPNGLQHGETRRGAGRSLEVFLSVDVSPRDLLLTTLHELQHVADVSAGLRLSRLELERRAVAFVGRCMGW